MSQTDSSGADAIETAVRLHGEALEALDRAEFTRAGTLAAEALALFERESGPDHPDVANVLNCLARAAEGAADYARALACARRSVEISSCVRGTPADPDLDRLCVQSLATLGNMERILARYADAEQHLRQALELARSTLGEEDEDVVSALNSLGVLYKYTGRFDEAAALYSAAIAVVEAGRRDEATLATLCHNLGGLEHARGEYARAEPPARRAVELRERALGPDHPSVAADVAALAAIVDARGGHADAEAMYRRALAIFERVYGPEHYEIAVTLNNLAGIRDAAGRPEEAEALYRRALSIKEALLGADHPDVAMTLNNLALLLASIGRGADAALLYARALQTFAAHLDRSHPKVQGCLANYLALLREQGRGAAAHALSERYAAADPG